MIKKTSSKTSAEEWLIDPSNQMGIKENKDEGDVPSESAASARSFEGASASRQLTRETEPELQVPLSTTAAELAARRNDSSLLFRMSSSFRRQVWLHVYDIDAVTARLNQSILRDWNLAAFHCGVEVCGEEWFFAWGESNRSGIMWNEPRGHQIHIYHDSVLMGETPFSDEEIRQLLVRIRQRWPANSYHPITRNCVTFAEEFIAELGANEEPFPDWVRGAMEVGKSPALYPIADWGWRWFKWWCSQDAPSHSAFQCT